MYPLPDNNKFQFYSRETKRIPYILLFETDDDWIMDDFIKVFTDKYSGYSIDKTVSNRSEWQIYITMMPLEERPEITKAKERAKSDF